MHFVCPVLAFGPSGIGSISDCLAASATLSDYRNSSWWRAYPDLGSDHAASPDSAQNLTSEFPG